MPAAKQGRLLIVDDTPDIAGMLQFFFTGLGYETRTASRGEDALAAAQQWRPHLILLDINMPGMDGYDVCRRLRTTLRTSHIPIIFLTDRNQQRDKVAGLALGVDDYITKPFDLEELQLRVANVLKRASQESLTHPVTGLPGAKVVEDQLRRLLHAPAWALGLVAVNYFAEFSAVYGFVAGDDALRAVALILTGVLAEQGTADDFLGQVGGADFVFTCPPERAQALAGAAALRFDRDVPLFYAYPDRQAGSMAIQEGGQTRRVPLMSLSIGIITQAQGPFTDIRELSEAASEARQHARLPVGSAVYMERET